MIDLHGLRQEEARRRLLAFLHDCQASGKKTAIVITGKGGPNPALAGERGVLRRAVPLWLAMPDLRALVGWLKSEMSMTGKKRPRPSRT